MDEHIDRALARAAEGPTDGIDIDEVAATARRRGRRRRLVAGAGAVLLALPIAVVVAWSEPGEDEVMLAPSNERESNRPPPEEGDAVDTPEGRAEVELEVRDEKVPRCGEVDLRPRNTGDIALSHGMPVQLERWDGGAWHDVPARPRGGAWAMPRLGVQPGEAGEWQQLRLDRLDHVEPDWYRLTKSFGDEPDAELTLQPSVVIQVVADERESDGDCGPSVDDLSELDPVDEGAADVTGDGGSDHVALYRHERGTSVLVKTADGDLATEWIADERERGYDHLGSRVLPEGQVGVDLAGDGRDEVLVRRENGRVPRLLVLAWHDNQLATVHRQRHGHLAPWRLRIDPDADQRERHWLECTDEGVIYHRGGPIEDEDASFALRSDTYRVTDGVAEHLEHTEEHVNELPDVDEPLVDCNR